MEVPKKESAFATKYFLGFWLNAAHTEILIISKAHDLNLKKSANWDAIQSDEARAEEKASALLHNPKCSSSAGTYQPECHYWQTKKLNTSCGRDPAQ